MKKENKQSYLFILTITRIIMGLIFLWAFLDKTFGLGFGTEVSKAWLKGQSPTSGFLQYVTTGPFTEFFQALAGSIFVDWLFMLGLLGIGIACILGIAMRFAGQSGAVLMFLMWLAVLPPENNPVLDYHIVYAMVFLMLAYAPTHFYSLQKQWSTSIIVQKFPYLQ